MRGECTKLNKRKEAWKMYWFIDNRGRKVRRSTQEDILKEAEALAKALRDAGGLGPRSLGPRSDDRIHVYKGRVLAFIIHGRSGHVEGHDLQGASQFVG
jgi:acyl-CoA synthetase (AMP-forming)/AMP-acid ligase II